MATEEEGTRMGEPKQLVRQRCATFFHLTHIFFRARVTSSIVTVRITGCYYLTYLIGCGGQSKICFH